MLYLLMGSIIFKPWEKRTRACVYLWREGIGSVSIWKTRAGWAGLVQTLRSQLGESLMKFQPFAAWLPGEAALVE